MINKSHFEQQEKTRKSLQTIKMNENCKINVNDNENELTHAENK